MLDKPGTAVPKMHTILQRKSKIFLKTQWLLNKPKYLPSLITIENLIQDSRLILKPGLLILKLAKRRPSSLTLSHIKGGSPKISVIIFLQNFNLQKSIIILLWEKDIWDCGINGWLLTITILLYKSKIREKMRWLLNWDRN